MRDVELNSEDVSFIELVQVQSGPARVDAFVEEGRLVVEWVLEDERVAWPIDCGSVVPQILA